MNITKQVVDRPFEKSKQSTILKEIRKTLGMDFYKRDINVLVNETKTANGIVGHDIITSTRCLITNYSVTNRNINGENSKVYNKTVYICEMEFPGIITKELIEYNLTKVLSAAVITPAYAFSNHHIAFENGKFYDYGITMIDLIGSNGGSFGIINFSDNSKNSRPTFKEIVYKDFYNPKYYINDECEFRGDDRENRNGSIRDYVDDNTTILYNPLIKKDIALYINNERKTGIYINDRTVKSSKLVNDLFSELLFIPIEELSFVYDSSCITKKLSPLNIKKISFFTKFVDSFKDECLEEIANSILTRLDVFSYEMKNKSDFYCVFNSNAAITILNIYFYDSGEELKIAVPNEKLYSEYALSSEIILNNIEYDGEIAKLDYIESKNPDTIGMIENASNRIDNVIQMIDEHTMKRQLDYEELRHKLLE